MNVPRKPPIYRRWRPISPSP